MTEKLATLGTVATSVAHEINNPLAIISGYSEDLLDRIHEGDKSSLFTDGEAYLSTICDQTKRCKTIISAWLATARLPTRTAEVVHVLEIASMVHELLLFRAQKKVVLLHAPVLHSPDKYEPVVLASSGDLQQVLLNILINAIDACHEGDSITMEVAVRPEACLVIIRDTGMGVKTDHLARLGTSFFTTKPPGQGTGLGLYISRELLRPWGGSLSIDSTGEGQGATVTIELPACERGGRNE